MGLATPPARVVDSGVSDPECVIHLVRDGYEQPCTPRDAYLWIASELPATMRPRAIDEVNARLAQLRAAAPRDRRAVAAPAVDRASIGRVLDDARRLTAAGDVTSCAIVVERDRIADAIALIEAALGDGDDIDVELVAGSGVDVIAGPSDIVLEVG